MRDVHGPGAALHGGFVSAPGLGGEPLELKARVVSRSPGIIPASVTGIRIQPLPKEVAHSGNKVLEKAGVVFSFFLSAKCGVSGSELGIQHMQR